MVVVLVGKWRGGHYRCTHTQSSENKQSLKARSGECLLSPERKTISGPKNPQREDVKGINEEGFHDRDTREVIMRLVKGRGL